MCSAAVFADMDTCFNCMYRFGSNEALEAAPPAEEDPAARKLAERRGEACLLGEFLVEFEGFLRDFLVDRKVDV